MLAIGRALLTNPTLLIMDEPSEGLAPTIVETLIETVKTLVAGGMAMLLVEQNLGVATARRRAAARDGLRADRRGDDVGALIADPEAQRRFLGVEPLAQHG